MDNNILVVSGLSKLFKSGKGVKEISFKIEKGEIFGIVGLNGAGKTTLLSTIIGFTKRDQGSIIYRIDGNNIDCFSPYMLNRIGIIVREQGFPDHFTASTVNKIMSHTYNFWNKKQFFSILEEFNIDTELKIKKYSTGMKSALAFAIALSHDSELLVLDEAMDGLDVLARKKARNYIKEFVKSGERSVIFTTHEIEEVEKLAGKILMIHSGNVLLNISKNELKEHYKIFKVTKEQYSNISTNDILYAKEDDGMYYILPNNVLEFIDQYKINTYSNSMEKTFEILLEGKQNVWNANEQLLFSKR